MSRVQHRDSRDMAVKRRRFIKTVLIATGAGPLLWLAERALPARHAEAIRARLYPGPVKELDAAELNQPGKWVG